MKRLVEDAVPEGDACGRTADGQEKSGRISAVINTYNAALHLERVLDSLAGFDEVVVCDMESTDSTVTIAERKGCRIVTFERGDVSICEPARNFAIRSACNEWVLVVDADEVVMPQLRTYLYRRIGEEHCPDALFVPRRNMFMGRYFHSSPDYQLRFFRRDKADWPPVIHCIPKINGVVEKIPCRTDGVHLLHLDDACMADRVAKLNRYTDYEVPKRQRKRYGWLALLFRPFWFFVRCYFVQGGVRDGMRGLIRAYMEGVYQVVFLSKIKENEWSHEEKQDSCQ